MYTFTEVKHPISLTYSVSSNEVWNILGKNPNGIPLLHWHKYHFLSLKCSKQTCKRATLIYIHVHEPSFKLAIRSKSRKLAFSSEWKGTHPLNVLINVYDIHRIGILNPGNACWHIKHELTTLYVWYPWEITRILRGQVSWTRYRHWEIKGDGTIRGDIIKERERNRLRERDKGRKL